MIIERFANSLSLPAWTQFLVELGASIEKHDHDGRIVSFLILPTLNYAALFISLGFALQSITNKSREKALREREAILRQLPSGAPVFIRRGKREFKGELIHTASGFKVKTSLGNKNAGPAIFSAPALKIRPTTKQVSLKAKPTSYRADFNVPFLASCFDSNTVDDFIALQSKDIRIIGNKTRLTDELDERLCSVDSQAGCLNDLLRMKHGNSGAGLGFIDSDLKRNADSTLSTHLTILDGSRSTNKHLWSSKSDKLVCLLSRRDHQFEYALDAMQEVIILGSPLSHTELTSPFPASVEYLTMALS